MQASLASNLVSNVLSPELQHDTAGLWRYSRHPNHVGEQLFWWGISLFALSSRAYWTLLGPLFNTICMVRAHMACLAAPVCHNCCFDCHCPLFWQLCKVRLQPDVIASVLYHLRASMVAHVLSKYRYRCYVKGCIKSGSLSLHELEYLHNAGTMCRSGATHLQCYIASFSDECTI